MAPALAVKPVAATQAASRSSSIAERIDSPSGAVAWIGTAFSCEAAGSKTSVKMSSDHALGRQSIMAAAVPRRNPPAAI
jgi:hypothetical protein